MNTKQNVEIIVEVAMNLSKELYGKLYEDSKSKYELELLRKKEPMAQTYDFVKEICDAFPEIKFDGLRMCFYNESEEIVRWSMRKDEAKNENAGKEKRDGCDCCIIL